MGVRGPYATEGTGNGYMVRLSLRFKKRLRKEFRSRWELLREAPPGPDRIALLIRFATEVILRNGREWRLSREQLKFRRRSFESQKNEWIGVLRPGACRACGRGERHRCWHHIILVSNGGSHGPKNRIAICEECHAQIHLHVRAPETTDDDLYRKARALLVPKFDALPRLVKPSGERVLPQIKQR